MSDSTTTARTEAKERPQAEPPSTTAPAAARGQSLWTRLKAMFACRTVSLRDDSRSRSNPKPAGETADFSPSERTILQNVLQLGEKRVDDVMVPRADIDAIDIDCTLGDMIARFRERRPFAHSGLCRQHRQHHRLHPRQGRAAAHHRGGRPIPRRPDAGHAGLAAALKQKLGKLDIVRTGAVRAAADAGGRSAAADAAEARPHGDRHRRIWRHRRRRHHRGSARGGGRRDRGRARRRGRPADPQDQFQHLHRLGPRRARRGRAASSAPISIPASMARKSTPSAGWSSRSPATCR